MKGHGEMENKININEDIRFADQSPTTHGHYLKGIVNISRVNTINGEKEDLFTGSNIIPISGYQWILMKMFGLHLDSVHDPNVGYEDIGQDSSIVIPDLNNDSQLSIGVDPKSYSAITDDIPTEHFIQGFMIGNGGAGEDAITTKNTDYSFIKLRNPIPFQQTTASQGLDSSIAGQYLGVYRQPGSDEQNFYIKKFDSRPHIYHNWWRDGQKWDYLDPVRQSDLGPDAQGTAKTNRIETYAEVEMSVDVKNNDCLGYFSTAGNTQTAEINELGLVAFDTIPGERSTLEALYKTKIKRILTLIFDNNRSDTAGEEVIALAGEIATVITTIGDKGQSNIHAFNELMSALSSSSAESIDYKSYQDALCEVDEDDIPVNIGVQASYNQNGTFIYTTDQFLTYLSSSEFGELTTDEAQRIKLITYYTFNAIPLQTNWKVLISYRIYAN